MCWQLGPGRRGRQAGSARMLYLLVSHALVTCITCFSSVPERRSRRVRTHGAHRPSHAPCPPNPLSRSLECTAILRRSVHKSISHTCRPSPQSHSFTYTHIALVSGRTCFSSRYMRIMRVKHVISASRHVAPVFGLVSSMICFSSRTVARNEMV